MYALWANIGFVGSGSIHWHVGIYVLHRAPGIVYATKKSEHHKWVILSPAGLGSYQGAQVILQQSSDFLHFVCILYI